MKRVCKCYINTRKFEKGRREGKTPDGPWKMIHCLRQTVDVGPLMIKDERIFSGAARILQEN